MFEMPNRPFMFFAAGDLKRTQDFAVYPFQDSISLRKADTSPIQFCIHTSSTMVIFSRSYRDFLS